MTVVLVILLLCALLVCWIGTSIGLPGNWAILAAAASYNWLLPASWIWPLGWPVFVALLVLAVVGELAELLAGFLRTRGVGGSYRSAVLSLVLSIAGGLAGAMIALPIPLIGPLIGAFAGSVLGALIGGLIGEFWAVQRWRQSLNVGTAAATGRLWGTLIKSMIGGVMIAVVVAGLIIG